MRKGEVFLSSQLQSHFVYEQHSLPEAAAGGMGDSDLDGVRIEAAICIENPVHRRLVEGALISLELVPALLETRAVDLDPLTDFDLVIADEPMAQRIRSHFAQREQQVDSINPALIAVLSNGPELPDSLSALHRRFDGVLPLPQLPAAVAAQLSLVLYAHRAFVRRYRTAIEELQLNRRIFRSVTSGICVSDAFLPDIPITYVNPAFEVMTGYSLEEAQGRNCRFLQKGDADQPALTILREALRDKREAVAVLRNYRKDGTPFWNEVSLSPIRSRTGEVTHFVGIQTDVTARIEFEAALRESEKLAAVGRLASSIAHEINNPLEAVMNLLYLGARVDSLSEARNYIGRAEQELERVKLITSQSLRFSKQSTKPQAAGCSELLDSVLELYRSRLGNGKIQVERRDRSRLSIVCMESELRQVLNNLVSNAIDSMRGRNGGRLLVRSREATEWRRESSGVLITIADTGCGIAEENLRNIYKAFFSTKGSLGTGLGLWISAEIVERHRGRLRVRSSQKPGNSWTIFELFLPYQGISPRI